MSRKPIPAPNPRRSRPVAPVAPVASGPHTCLQCPACGTEACLTLQDLGMYCDTLCAASESMRAEKRPTRKRKNAA